MNLIEELYALQAEHGYQGSYKSVRKFVRRHFPPPRRRPFRRIETPPGAQSQTDWMEFRRIDVGDDAGPTTLFAFVMTLSHSRKEAVIWSRSMNQLAWHHCHNEAFRRLGGVAASWIEVARYPSAAVPGGVGTRRKAIWDGRYATSGRRSLPWPSGC